MLGQLEESPMKTNLKVVLAEKDELLKTKGAGLCSVTPDTPASDAIRIMCEANIGCVLVLDGHKLVGIFSERDVLHRLSNKGLEPAGRKVRDVMTSDVITVSPTITVEDALAECTDRRVRHLPVVEDGELIGLLSIGDLVRYVVKDKERTISDLTSYIHGTPIQV